MTTSVDLGADLGADNAPAGPKTWGFWMTLVWALGAAMVLLVSQLVVAVAFIVAMQRAHPEQNFGIEQAVSNGPLIAWTIIISTPLLAAFLYLATRRARTPFADYLALRWPAWRQVVLGFVSLGVVLGIVAFAEQFAHVETPAFMTDTFRSAEMAGELSLIAFAFIIAAPFAEEILFRGFLFRGFVKSLGPIAATFLTAILWASLHVQYQLFFIGEIVALGLLFGSIRWITGSTLLTFIMHATVNGTALVMLAVDGT